MPVCVVVLVLPPRQPRPGERHVGGDVVDDGEERRTAVGEAVEGATGALGHGLGDVLVADPVAVEEARPAVGVDAAHLGVPEGPARRLVPRAQSLVAVEELAVVRRPVARRLQPPADVHIDVAQPLGTTPSAGVVAYAVALGVLPRDELGPSRAAHRVRRDRVREANALVDQQPPRLGEVAQLVRAHVVGQDEDDVRSARGCCCLRRVGRRRAGYARTHERAGHHGDDHDRRREDHRSCPPHACPPHAQS